MDGKGLPMKSILFSLFILAGCAFQPSRQPQSVSTIVPSAEDLFLTGKFMVKKKIWKLMDENHYGEELDLSTRRPVYDLTGTIFENKYGKAGTKLFANFFHEGRFHIVRLPHNAVEKVHFQLSYFPPLIGGRYIAAHSLIRFELTDAAPLEIVAPMPDEAQLAALTAASENDRLELLPDEQVGVTLKNVVISAEAQWVKNDRDGAYNLRRGKNGAYIQIVRFVSMQDRWTEFYNSGNPASQIQLSTEKGDEILAEALKTSQSDALTKLYDTFWYNCTTIAFDIVERGAGIRDPRLGHIRSFMQRRIPVRAPRMLEGYGGLEGIPMTMDQSMARDAWNGYQITVRGPARQLCLPAMSSENCRNVNQAVEMMKAAGVFQE